MTDHDLKAAIVRRVGRREVWLIGAMAMIATAFWAFVELADEVVEGSTAAFDRTILLVFRVDGDVTDPIGPHWVEMMVSDTTALGGVVILTMMTVIVIGYLIVLRKRAAAVFVLVAIGGGTAASFLLKAALERARPDIVPHAVETATASFPSGHAMLSAVTYLTLGALLARFLPQRRAKVYVVTVSALLTLAIGTSRVYLGVHWPTDVLAGWAIGAGWALLCWLGALWLQSRDQVEDNTAQNDSDR